MKARLVPVYFPGINKGFFKQLDTLKTLLAGEAEIFVPAALGEPLPEAEAALFPQMLGKVFDLDIEVI